MGDVDNVKIRQLEAERDRYKLLAQDKLRDNAINRLLDAARRAAIEALSGLPADEREALEGAIGKPLKDALAEGVSLRMNGESLELKSPAPERS